MEIVIVGDGKVGNTLAEQLSQEDHNVVIIDNNEAALKKTTDRFDVIGVVGNGATYPVQLEAGVDHADLLIAVTAMDERNILCCIVAKGLGVKHTVARVRNPEYSEQMRYLEDALHFSRYINPELAAAREISQILRCPAATQISPFARGRAELAEFKLAEDSPLAGVALRELRGKYQVNIVVCAVQRESEVLIPSGDFVLQEGDRITIVSSPREIDDFFDKANLTKRRVHDVMIAGGSKIGYYLADILLRKGMNVKIVENNAARCRALSVELPRASIVCGDARDWELVHEEGMDGMDAYITLTGFDEENIILSMYANSLKIPKVITKVNDPEFPEVMDKIGLDIIISPLRLIADQIVGYVRALRNSEGCAMETLHKLVGDKLEAVDFHVKGDLPFLGVPLKVLRTRPNTLIACIVRGGKAIIPDGECSIQKNDNVIIICESGKIKELQDLVE